MLPLRPLCQALSSFLNPLNSFNSRPLGPLPRSGSALGTSGRGGRDSPYYQGAGCLVGEQGSQENG